MRYSTTNFKQHAQHTLLLAISTISLGLTACGGNDKYQAHSCIGQANSPDDCRHFNQPTNANTNTDSTTDGNTDGTANGNTDSTTDGNTTDNNTASETETTAWKNFIYDANNIKPLTANAAISFEKHHKDELFDAIDIVDDNAVVASHYHNRLRRFVLNDGVATLQQAIDYATAPGGRDDVDSVSGATEQLLTNIDMQDASSGLIVVGEVKSVGRTDTGVGIYVDRADSAGNFKDIRFASSESTQYYPLANITAQALSKDGAYIAASNKSGQLIVLNASTLVQKKSTDIGFEIHGLAFSPDGQWLYVSGKKKVGLFGGEGVIVVLDAQTLSEKGRINSADEVDFVRVWALDNQQLIAQVAASKYALMLQWQADGGQVIKKRQISMPSSINSATIIQDSKKGNYLALADSQNNVNVIQLSTGKRAGFTYKQYIDDLALDNQGFIWILSGNSLASVPYSLP